MWKAVEDHSHRCFLMACSLVYSCARDSVGGSHPVYGQQPYHEHHMGDSAVPGPGYHRGGRGRRGHGILLFITLYKVDGLRGKTVSEDSGKRGLRAFMDWVENGPDWRMRPVCVKAGAGGHGEADTIACFGSGCKERNTKRTMGSGGLPEFTEEHALPCIQTVPTGL